MAARQLQLIDEPKDSQTVQTADRLVGLVQEEREIKNKLALAQSQLISLFHMSGKKAIRHGGMVIKLQSTVAREKLVVRPAKKTETAKAAVAAPPSGPTTAKVPAVPDMPTGKKPTGKRLVKHSLKVSK